MKMTFQPSKSSWFQSKNEHGWRKKSISCQKSKRKKSFVSIGHFTWSFPLYKKMCPFGRSSLNWLLLQRKISLMAEAL